jgi:hypothetical protein
MISIVSNFAPSQKESVLHVAEKTPLLNARWGYLNAQKNSTCSRPSEEEKKSEKRPT